MAEGPQSHLPAAWRDARVRGRVVARWVAPRPELAGLLAGSIDLGMRSGIPEEDWSVETGCGAGAEERAASSGDPVPRNTRVMLLDGGGLVRWFHDSGDSCGGLLDLTDAIEEL